MLPDGEYTGAAVLFGASGVMEATCERYANWRGTLEKLDFHDVGHEGGKEPRCT